MRSEARVSQDWNPIAARPGAAAALKSFFGRRFSSSSAFSFFAADTSMPPNLAFHL